MDYYGTNDWWGYLEHWSLGKETKEHKYYARIPVGTKNGKVFVEEGQASFW